MKEFYPNNYGDWRVITDARDYRTLPKMCKATITSLHSDFRKVRQTYIIRFKSGFPLFFLLVYFFIININFHLLTFTWMFCIRIYYIPLTKFLSPQRFIMNGSPPFPFPPFVNTEEFILVKNISSSKDLPIWILTIFFRWNVWWHTLYIIR